MPNDHEKIWRRVFIHVDMDAFFASVEQLDNPELRGKPVIVGGSPEGRGVVSAASYEARKFGVHSAMAMGRALSLCPAAIRIHPRMERYSEISHTIMSIFHDFTPAVEPLSVDEAFLDITGSQRLLGTPEKIGHAIKNRIKSKIGLTASVGIAPNKFVAKLASDMEKPNGFVVIREEDILPKLAPLPIRTIWGVGRVLAGKLEKLGIETVADLRKWPRKNLSEMFGATGEHIYNLARGFDLREISLDEPEKSISNETTFSRDLTALNEIQRALLMLSDKVAARARARGYYGRTVQLKVRYDDFTTVTRRQTCPTPLCTGQAIFDIASDLLDRKTRAGEIPVRLIGVGISGLSTNEDSQAGLFDSQETIDSRREKLERTADSIRKKLGQHSISRASYMRKPSK